MINRNTYGSEWRKWDLHIHTPDTAKNDNFSGGNKNQIWEKYVETIENNKDIAVLGITDYFSIENYLKLKDLQKEGRLNNVYLLPNVELRIIPVTTSETPINMHILFSPDLDMDIIERDFFSQLTFKYSGSTYRCIKKDLINLGKTFKNNQNLNDVVAYREGINQFVVSVDSIKKILKQDSLKGFFLVGVSNSSRDGNSGIQDSALCAIRREIYRMADIIFSANPKDIQFFLGKDNSGKSIEQTIISDYGGLKPCVRGCDAHSFENMFKFDSNRYTWIKASPSFEGLKQIVYEPETRVKIQENKPEEKVDYHIIDSICFDNQEMGKQEIFFNQNLNTIIGGRSSGKSVLIGCLAHKVDPSIEAKPDNPEYNKMIDEFAKELVVNWRDKQQNSDHKITYFSQSQISNLCRKREDGLSGIDDIITKIIQNENDYRILLDKYNSFKIDNESKIRGLITNFILTRDKINKISSQMQDIGNKQGIKNEIYKIENEIHEIKESLSYGSDIDNKEEYENKKNLLKENKGLIDQNSSDISQLELLRDHRIFFDIDGLLGKLSNKQRIAILDYYSELRKKTGSDWLNYINSIIKSLTDRNRNLEKGNDEIINNSIYIKGKELESENLLLTEKEKLLEQEQNKLNQIEDWEKVRQSLIEEKNKQKSEILCTFKEYYSRVQEVVNLIHFSKDDVEISSLVINNYKKFFDIAKDLFNMKSGVGNKYSQLECDETAFWSIVEQIFEKIDSEEILIKASKIQQAYLSLYAENYFNISFDVKYDGDQLSQMSEGKKAFIVLRLLLDFDDSNCPILIDQPEDDLDNRAIYDDLVKYLRNKKQIRQIILVTHNPNIVVGADAELVIVANQNGVNNRNTDNVKFQYYGNSLEDTFKNDDENTSFLLSRGIREHICDILEGGKRAFEIREKKYGYNN